MIDLIDQEKAENMVSQTINNELGCFDSIFVLGTRLMGYKNATDDKLSTEDENAGWYERWIVEACKQYRTINIAILPDPKTRYNYVIQIAKEEE